MRGRLTAPVDVASLAAFRILFGALVATAAIRFLAKGWVEQLLIQPPYHFPYAGFSWVRVWPAPFMHLHFVALAVAAIALALGFHTRLAACLTFAGFTYVELTDKALYLNHYYLVSLLAGMLVLLPVGRALSLDARRHPTVRIDQVPAWMLYALRAQLAIVYVHAGLTKLNADWLLRAQPLRIWLNARSDVPLLGPLLEGSPAAFVASWAGAAFDLGIVFLLLARRTRRAAFAAVVVFHVGTAVLFHVGMFPWVMIASATLFLAPDWPRALWPRLRLRAAGEGPRPAAVTRPAIAVVLGVHLAIQAALPCRQYFDGEPSAWTYRGFNFAWNVMIVEKTGDVSFTLVDRDGAQVTRRRAEPLLTPTQTSAMAQDPEMIRTFARHLAARARAEGRAVVAVRADAFAALNGGPRRRLIDPAEDLLAAD